MLSLGPLTVAGAVPALPQAFIRRRTGFPFQPSGESPRVT